MEKTWRLIIDGALEPERNMAIDEAIMNCVVFRRSPPTLRVYRWLYPCVSVGKFQKADDGLADAAPFVRRPTGGGLVRHGGSGFTYSLIYRESDDLVERGVAASYRQVHTAVAAALTNLGMAAELHLAADGGKMGTPGCCFSSPVDFDVMAGGTKVAGAAQRRRFGVVLHQGEVSLTLDAPGKPSYNAFLTAFINSLSGQLRARFFEGPISEEEDCLVEGLLMKRTEEVTR